MNDELRKAAGTAVDVWDDTGTRHEDVVNAMNDLRKVLAKNANAAPFDFHTHLARQAAWSSKTFGPGDRAQGVVDHIRKELREIEQAPGDLEEWIDVVILALDGAWRSGATPEQIIAAIVAKQTKNEARNWPDWRTADPSKAIEHVKELPNAVPQDQDAKDAADIFWDYEDGEYCVRSIQEICENACDRGAENGAVLRVNQAKSLPHIFLRLIVPENPDDSVDYVTISESEAIATMQQEQKP